jgi:L-ribulokinase
MMSNYYSVGLDFGTASVRALLVDVATGEEIATGMSNYRHGSDGVIVDTCDPLLARQHPQDYLDGAQAAIHDMLIQAKATGNAFDAAKIIGIGVDTTGSSPMPVDKNGRALALDPALAGDPAAKVWLWKDHTAHVEAEEITTIAGKIRPQYLAKCGGRYSSEWFWAKIWHCARTAPKVFDAAYTWVEIADWIPAAITGTTAPDKLRRGICAAGHKAFYNPCWGGYPDAEFLGALDPRLVRVGKTLSGKAYSSAAVAGTLTPYYAEAFGLPAGISVAVGAFDAHLGAVGAGVKNNVLVKLIGTSTCDIMVVPETSQLTDIPGLCGIVPGSVLPNYFGLEAGQSAVGDIFNWFVSVVQPGGAAGSHEALTRAAAEIKPGASGLLSLDWHNGNRTILVDQRLTGLIMGLTLHSTPAELYRTLIEATAFGARVIMERFEEFGLPVHRIINGGGISAKNHLAMQIYADVMNRSVGVSRSGQTCALGAAIAGAVAAGKSRGGHATFDDAIISMVGEPARIFTPIAEHVAVYQRLFKLYRQLHDALGRKDATAHLGTVMKDLLDIRDQARS